MLFVNARYLTQERTGVQRFAEEISLSLRKIRKDLVFLSPPGIIRSNVAKKLQVQEIGTKKGHRWEQIELPRYLKKNGSGLLLNLGNTAPIFYKNQIITHHDVAYKRHPASFSKKFRLFYNIFVPLMLKKSKWLFTVSEFSKCEINDIYGYPLDKISVIYNAVNEEFKKGQAKNTDPYFLAVSSPSFHKNFHGMLQAFSALSKNHDVALKIIGKTTGSFSKQDFSSLIKTSKKIDFLGRVEDEEMIMLYQNAHAFIFPSFYEGFGIPPLEAQSCGCPVISSNTASMPEVLRDSALYFDPYNMSQMVDAMERILLNRELRLNLIEKGDENAKRYSWMNSAHKVSQIVDEILK
ncbi:glycosyltransferase family 4 protein [Serratia fonticola]